MTGEELHANKARPGFALLPSEQMHVTSLFCFCSQIWFIFWQYVLCLVKRQRVFTGFFFFRTWKAALVLIFTLRSCFRVNFGPLIFDVRKHSSFWWHISWREFVAEHLGVFGLAHLHWNTYLVQPWYIIKCNVLFPSIGKACLITQRKGTSRACAHSFSCQLFFFF